MLFGVCCSFCDIALLFFELHCLMLTVLLFVVSCSLRIVRCSSLCVGGCLLFVVSRELFVACCLLLDAINV